MVIYWKNYGKYGKYGESSGNLSRDNLSGDTLKTKNCGFMGEIIGKPWENDGTRHGKHTKN